MTEVAWSNLLVLEARPGSEKTLEELLSQFTLSFRSLRGCLQYDCFQSFENPSRFMLQIRFVDGGCLQDHLQGPELIRFFEKVSAVLLTPDLEGSYRDFAAEE